MKKVTASANILVDPRDAGWKKDIHNVAAMLNKAAAHSTRMRYHTLNITNEQKELQKNEAEFKIIAKQLASAYPDLDMYFIEAKGGFSFSGDGRRYDILHAAVRGGELSLELVSEIGKEDDDGDY